MKQYLLTIGSSLLMFAAFAQVKKPAATRPAAVKPAVAGKPAATGNVFKSNIDSASYAIGVSLYRNFERDGLSNINIDLLYRALSDQQKKKKPLLDDAAIGACLSILQEKVGAERNAAMEKQRAEMEKLNEAKAEPNRKAAQAFLAENGKRAGVVTLPSGLQYEVIQQGTSDQKPALTSSVKCNYKGTLLNGEKFDASEDHGGPATFPLNRVIAGWQQAIQLMTVGSKWKLYIPSELGYGNSGSGTIPPGALLVFEVELLGIE